MSTEAPKLTSAESDFLAQLCGFAERRAQNGVYVSTMIAPHGAPVIALIAFGSQALAVQNLIMSAQVPESPLIEVVSSLDDASIKDY